MDIASILFMLINEVAVFRASAPGSLMIMGEYAVLYGHMALCASINRYLHVTISPRKDSIITIDSSLGQLKTDIHSLNVQAPFEFVLACLKNADLKTGCDIHIHSEFSHRQGLGSSAAVTVATLAALGAWKNKTISNDALLKEAIHIIRLVQKKGSGADAAASIYGGIVCYQRDTVLEKLSSLPNVTVIFSGEKTKTAQAINRLDPALAHTTLFSEMGALAEKAKKAITQADWSTLGNYFIQAQEKLSALNVSTPTIDHLLTILAHEPAILGAKISGAGLGDCVIALGETQDTRLNILPIQLGLGGLKIATTLSQKKIIDQLIPHKNPKQKTATQFAPSNIALCKYWGKRDEIINLPMNSSLSISLADKGATVTISVTDKEDVYSINGDTLSRNSDHYTRLNDYFNLFRSKNAPAFSVTLDLNIPLAAGLASSACIYAAIAKSLNVLFDWQLTSKTLSIIARLGSGSASRSIETGFVAWHRGALPNGLDSVAEKLALAWPSLRVGLTQLQTAQKKISSRKGMQRTVETSPLYRAWPEQAEADFHLIKEAIQQKNMVLLGETAERNALMMHATMLGAQPPLLYSTPETLSVMQRIWQARTDGVVVYFTQDAGPNLKLLFLEEETEKVKNYFPDLTIIKPFDESLNNE